MKVWFPVIRAESGTDVFTRRLAGALSRFGITTDITWFSKRYELTPFLLRSFPPPSGTQIIHANSWNGFAFARRGIPLVVTEHLNALDTMYRPYKDRIQHAYHQTLIRWFMAASFRAASSITAVSHFVASSLSRTLDVKSVQTIHNWIDTRAFHPPLQTPRNTDRPFRLLFVGNLSRRKGADLLVPIMTDLGSDFELRFTSGLDRRKILAAVPNMLPLGRLTRDQDLVEAYHRCDALLFPTRFEGFGLSALEAMACGKPVIATNSCSLPEIIADGIGGILCPTNDIGAFVSACRRLAHDHEIKDRLGRAARGRAEQKFSEERIIPQYVTLYEKLLK